MRLKTLRKKPALRWTDALKQLPTLSVRQPYAWLIVNGIKDIENRSRRVNYRGLILIHASMSKASLYMEDVEECQAKGGYRMPDSYDVGGIIGVAEIVDCVRRHASPWKYPSEWGWVLANARPLPFRECKGAVGFFYPKL